MEKPTTTCCLVHNVSHSDLLVGIRVSEYPTNLPDGSPTPPLNEFILPNLKPGVFRSVTQTNQLDVKFQQDRISRETHNIMMGRPNYNVFQPIAQSILDVLLYGESTGGLDRRKHKLSEIVLTQDGINDVGISLTLLHHPVSTDDGTLIPLPIGFSLEMNSSQKPNFADFLDDALTHFHFHPQALRNRNKYIPISQCSDTTTDPSSKPKTKSNVIAAVYFPLLSVLYPLWLENTNEFRNCNKNGATKCHTAPALKRTILLISGSGYSKQREGDFFDNSTEATSKLLELFLRKMDPTLEIVRLHGDGVFKFSENISFVNKMVIPLLRERRKKSLQQSSLWFRETIPHVASKNSLLNANILEESNSLVGVAAKGLESGHFGFRMNSDHSNSYHSVNPDLPFNQTVTVSKSPRWEKVFRVTLTLSDGAPARVSALMASLKDFKPQFMHLWRPKAFFHSGELLMSDIDMITPQDIETKPAIPIQSDALNSDVRAIITHVVNLKNRFESSLYNHDNDLNAFWLRKTQKPVISVLAVRKHESQPLTFHCGMNLEVSMPTGTLCSERNAIGNALTSDMTLKREHFCYIAVLSLHSLSKKLIQRIDSMNRNLGAKDISGFESDTKDGDNFMHKKFLKRSKIHDDSKEEDGDLNPLNPCGACAEWLRKINEVNPDFQVITFDSVKCDSVYIRNVE